MTADVLLWAMPFLILTVALLGVRRYSFVNAVRHLGGLAVVLGTLALSMSVVLEPFAFIFLGAIGGTLIGQAYEAENRRAADRKREAGLAVGT